MCRLLDQSQAFGSKGTAPYPPKKIGDHFAMAGLGESAERVKFRKAVMDEVGRKWCTEAEVNRNGMY